MLEHSESEHVDYPKQVRTVTIDYQSPDSLKAALQAVDAVVCILGKSTGLKHQFNLIDAAAAAGVKRFLPSEFGADLRNSEIRTFPTYQSKVQVEEYIEKKARDTDLTYTYVYNSLLLDVGLALNAFMDFSAQTVNFFDGGDTKFSSTRIRTVSKAVVAVLSKYEETKNRAVCIQDFSTTPRQLLELVQGLDPDHIWTAVPVDTGKLVKDAKAELQSVKFSPKAFAAYATRATFAPHFAESYRADDNELLGISEMTEEEVREMLKARV